MNDLKEIRQQKEWLMQGMSSVPIDGKEYAQMREQYQKLVETEEVIKDGRRKRGVLETGLKIGAFLVTAAGVLIMPGFLGNLAYTNEAEFRSKNGTVWNLIGKDLSPKNFNPFNNKS